MIDMPDHELYRTIVETREYRVVPEGDAGLRVNWEDGGAFHGDEMRATIRCICGERFRKDETARAHLDEHTG